MYIESVPNRNSPPAILLRESFREKGRVRKRTLANLSDWPIALVEGLRTLLKGGVAVAAEGIRIRRALPHGHAAAVLGTIRAIGLRGQNPPSPAARRRRRGRDDHHHAPRPADCTNRTGGLSAAARNRQCYRRYNGACQTKPEGNSRRNSLTSSGRTKVLMGWWSTPRLASLGVRRG
jgi:hypothetical protein